MDIVLSNMKLKIHGSVKKANTNVISLKHIECQKFEHFALYSIQR